MKRIPKDYFTNEMTYTTTGAEDDKYVYERIYAKYDSYDIYTTNEKIIEADKKINKYDERVNFFGMLTLMFFIFALILIGCSVENKGYIDFNNVENLVMFIIGCCSIVCFIGVGIYWLIIMHIVSKNEEIKKSFKVTDEYIKQYDKILKQEEKKRQAILKTKAKNLITVYDTLDNKDMQIAEKIKIIKNYMKEDD